MKFLPIFLKVSKARIVVAGGGDEAVAKLRLLLKTEARIEVYGPAPDGVVEHWAQTGRLTLIRRFPDQSDVAGAALVYSATGEPELDARVADLARAAGVPFNIVDDLENSGFITPAMVDRDPVVIAIGTEGAAPVLARSIKADLESRLPSDLGPRTRAAQDFRDEADRLPKGAPRREFWAEYFATPDLPSDPEAALRALLDRHLNNAPRPGHVDFVGAGPGDPDDLTIRARRALDRADVVIHDRLVPAAILELTRREAQIIEAGKTGFGESVPQDEINRLIVEHASSGAQVVRLKSGDPGVFGRLDEEIEACEAAGVGYTIVPGITAASAAVAGIGQSLTRRGRNSDVRLMTGHDAKGFAEHDWTALARPGAVAAIYMGKKSARFVQGRLMMHGADPATPVTVVENAGRPGQRILATSLAQLEPDLTNARVDGPAVILLGLAPRGVAVVLDGLREVAR